MTPSYDESYNRVVQTLDPSELLFISGPSGPVPVLNDPARFKKITGTKIENGTTFHTLEDGRTLLQTPGHAPTIQAAPKKETPVVVPPAEPAASPS